MKTCNHCGSTFEPRRGGRPQAFCSRPCKVTYYNRIWNARKPRLTTRRLGTAARAMQFTDEQQQIVLGTLLGDGSLIRLYNGSTRLSMTHAIRQRDYLQWKRDKLAFVFHKEAPNECSKGDSKFLVIGSVCHPWFGHIYSSYYHHGRKHIPDLFLRTISPLSLAIWYQDDGAYNTNPRSLQATLCTDAYPHTEVNRTADVLRSKFDLNISVYKHPYGGSTFGRSRPMTSRIVILRSSVLKFFDIIRPHIHPCMAYKISA